MLILHILLALGPRLIWIILLFFRGVYATEMGKMEYENDGAQCKGCCTSTLVPVSLILEKWERILVCVPFPLYSSPFQLLHLTSYTML